MDLNGSDKPLSYTFTCYVYTFFTPFWNTIWLNDLQVQSQYKHPSQIDKVHLDLRSLDSFDKIY